MAKKRLHELATELGMDSRVLKKTCAEMGIIVKNHMSALDDLDVEQIVEKFSPEKETQKKPVRKKAFRVVKKAREVEVPAAGSDSDAAPAAPEVAAAEPVAAAPAESVVAPEPVASVAEPVAPAPKAVVVAPPAPKPQAVAPAMPVRAKPGPVVTPASAGRPKSDDNRRPAAKKDAKPGKGKKRSVAKTLVTFRDSGAIEERDVGVKGEQLDSRKVMGTPSHGKNRRNAHANRSGGALRKKGRSKAERRRDRLQKRQEEEEQRQQTLIVEQKTVKITETVMVCDLAESMKVAPTELVRTLFGLGVFASLNQRIDAECAALVAAEFGFEVETTQQFGEEIFDDIDRQMAEDSSDAINRAPVVTIMGHVDHGKTHLLDTIRNANVISGESGGITQHIGAYKVSKNNHPIVFLDTPGHEAFTAMRARGAGVTDIVILVVAADDGVMPQTREAIDHARAAEAPIIVAINKMDKPEANPERIKQQLMEFSLLTEELGGETIFCEVSAKANTGIDNLLEMILLQAEMMELKAVETRFAVGSVVEAKLSQGRGPVSTILVQDGTLKVGDTLVVGQHHGKVRALITDSGEQIQEAGPSTPVEVLGIDGVPLAGDQLRVVRDEREAKLISGKRKIVERERQLSNSVHITLEDLYEQIQKGEVKELNLVLKADVQGSLEAIIGSIQKIDSEKVNVKVIHSAAGGITESDIMLAAASNAIVVGFKVRPTVNAKLLAERERIDIRLYQVIYDLINEIKNAMEGMLDLLYKEVVIGRSEVRSLIKVPKVGFIAGSYITDGEIGRGALVRLIRDNIVIAESKVVSLRRFKDDVKLVKQGFECGIGLDSYSDLKEGDVIECYKLEGYKQEL